ncbi:hypothetical protein [Loktanella sp. M215]|uniref:hypothetical protein n=1 Tax=Loktanella sp. M215 TaxID=2675431 RepID=UPI001F8CA302|nr:hypothetical protein [Loktanella sp. M215]
MRWVCVAAVVLAGCSGANDAPPSAQVQRPEYLGVRTELLDGDLVNFKVSLRGPDTPEAVEKYAECAAAQYALIRGYNFARLVRTNVTEEGGTWAADAVYTISPDLPRGLVTIDAVVTVADCGTSGIPTV